MDLNNLISNILNNIFNEESICFNHQHFHNILHEDIKHLTNIMNKICSIQLHDLKYICKIFSDKYKFEDENYNRFKFSEKQKNEIIKSIDYINDTLFRIGHL